jgi:type IV pilus assembly protein PilN
MIHINLLPIRKSQKRDTGLRQLMVMGVVLIITLGIVMAYYISLDNKLVAVKDEIAKDEAEISRLEKIIGEVKTIEDEKKKLQQQLQVIEELNKGKAGPVKVLDAIASAIPKRVWIEDFTENNGSGTITGYGLEMADVSEFLKALEKSPHFKEVRLGFTEAQPQKGVSTFKFTLTAKIAYNI